MENKYEIQYFIDINSKINDIYNDIFNKEKISKLKELILKELEIKEKKNVNFVWRRQNALSLSLKKINKDLLFINSEVNKITENKFLVIYKNIKELIIKKTDISKENKLYYLINNLLEKCFIQVNFNSLYMCFLKKLYQETNLDDTVKKVIKDITKLLEKIIFDFKELDEVKNLKFIEFLKKNNDCNRNYIYLSNIYSLFYLYDLTDTKKFFKLICNYIEKINIITNKKIENNLLEKLINILIGLLEFGYFKLKKNIKNDEKIKLNFEIEKILNKKINLRIKFNLKNMFEDLNSNKLVIKKYNF